MAPKRDRETEAGGENKRVRGRGGQTFHVKSELDKLTQELREASIQGYSLETQISQKFSRLKAKHGWTDDDCKALQQNKLDMPSTIAKSISGGADPNGKASSKKKKKSKGARAMTGVETTSQGESFDGRSSATGAADASTKGAQLGPRPTMSTGADAVACAAANVQEDEAMKDSEPSTSNAEPRLEIDIPIRKVEMWCIPHHLTGKCAQDNCPFSHEEPGVAFFRAKRVKAAFKEEAKREWSDDEEGRIPMLTMRVRERFVREGKLAAVGKPA